MAQENNHSGNLPVGGPKRKRSAAEWAIVVLLIVAILGGLAIETSARLGFQKTLTKLQLRVSAPEHPVPEPIKADEADALVSGWPKKTVEKVGEGANVEYRWRSLFLELVIQLKVAADGTVLALDTNLPELPDVEAQPKPLRATPVQYARGLASGSAPGFALELIKFVPWQPVGEQGHLTRELIRQAVLIAARDELGLPTRDKALNEPLPEEKDPSLPVMNLVNWNIENRHVSVTLVAPARQGLAQPIPFEFDVPPGGWLEELATVTESLSSTEFAAALRKAGFNGQARPFLAEGAVGDAILEDLTHFDMLSQYAAVRALHNEIAVLGESPDRLAALSQGYANLGALTEYLWHPAYKVFAARGLQYAERLLRKTVDNPLALHNRAYVRALTGLHSSALADLAAAAALPATGEAPAWVAPIEAFCRSDTRGLAVMLDRGKHSSLPAYLNLLLAASSEIARIHLDAAQRMIALAPDCMPAYEMLQMSADLGPLRHAAESAPASFSTSLRLRLGSRDYIPESARKLLSDRSANVGFDMKTRAELVQALTEAGSLGKDTGEPSLAALATLIREASFVQAWRLLSFQSMSLGVDVTDTRAAVKPIVKGHPFESFIDVHVSDQVAAARAMGNVMQAIAEIPVEPSISETVQMYRHYKPRDIGNENVERNCANFARQSDPIFPDLVRILRMDASAKLKSELSATLRGISPFSPAGIAAALTHDWDRVGESAKDWERQYGDSPDVVKALANRYVALDRFEDAERCLKRRIELVPEHEAYQALAKLYSKHGDEQRWVDTLLASLKLPALGLDDDRSRVDLANYFMRRKEWEKARPHVEIAARSYANWALSCASDFYEGTGDWTKAELFQRAISERYEHSAKSWYLWCRRTGRGDLAAARAQMQAELEYLRSFPTVEGRGTASTLLTLEGQPEESFRVLHEGVELGNRPFYCLLAALRADELRQTALRDKFLKQAANKDDYSLAEFRHWVRAFVAVPDAPLDRKLLDWAIREGSTGEGQTTSKNYLAGSFLAAHGYEREARDYLERAATAGGTHWDEAILAAHALRQRGLPIGESRVMEFDAELTQWLKQLKAARELADSGKWDDSVEKCTKLIEQAPEFPDVYEQRSFDYLQLNRFEPALADISRALDLLPTCARFLCARGVIEERLGRYQAAIDDYHAALKSVPDYSRAHHELAFLHGACPDPKFRDARQAQTHAQLSFESGETPLYVAYAALAVAAAEGGDFTKAVQLQNLAIELAHESWRPQLLERQKLFERGEPYHRPLEWWKRK